VLLGLPVCVFGAFLGVKLVGLENNVYVQIGIVTLMGLAAKNAILIVEFAKDYHERKGMGLVAAANAVDLRGRPAPDPFESAVTFFAEERRRTKDGVG